MRKVLDTIATVAVIVLSVVMIWALVAQPAPPLAAGPSTNERLNRDSRSKPVVPTEAISLEGAASAGSPSAPVVIVEFSDFQCPYCGRFARDVLPELEREYITVGRVQIVFRHLPLEQIHPQAFAAAVAATCAAEQGQFWQLHDRLFELPPRFDDTSLVKHAEGVGLAKSTFSACTTRADAAARVRSDIAEAKRYSVTGTPTFFVGVRQSDGRVKVTERLGGTGLTSQFKKVIDKVLSEALPLAR